YTDPETGEPIKRKNKKSLAPVGSKIPDGPLARGFDYYHGFHHAGDMKGVIENDTVIAHEDEVNMLPRLARHAVKYINERAKTPGQPFFLYVPFGSPHNPIVPTEEWKGKSGINGHADFVMQTDDAFGQILDALEKNGFAENTLVVFTSDNGTSKSANFPELEAAGHAYSAWMRGSKADIWDGGHRIPFVVRWPGKVEAGSTNDQQLCMIDVFATVAELTGKPLPENGAEDSVSFYPALFGKPIESTRAGIVHHTVSGHFGYRMGKWKICLAYGSGGWSAPKEGDAKKQGLPEAKLYDLENDPAETTNLYASHPEVAARLIRQLEEDIFRGRSTKGPAAKNDVPNETIKLWKSK
ncbi:sulfatase-like hydrolase/transferase, partial [Pontiella sp.]|uniref:sulfatase-like hydrolase/transferase n=1 Tax=Pontiella sp. TaxID=2837462 RepID=UPI00356361EB